MSDDNIVSKDTGGSVKPDRETAEKEYARLVQSWKIKESKDAKSESGAEEAVIEAIMSGIVMIKSGNGERLVVVQKLDQPIGEHEELTYRFPIASDMMQMDNFKEIQQFNKSAAMIASVTGVGNKLVGKMGGPDFMLGQSIAFCFLGV